ncbi:MAG: hypothetical protein IJ373_00045 [Clostridia bacterium]|nr:hypothetical protein [Clostridia bacterium]
MKTKEVLQEKTVAVADFTKALCALAQEHLIGLVKTVGENEFIFSLPGGIKTFRLCVTEEKSA